MTTPDNEMVLAGMLPFGQQLANGSRREVALWATTRKPAMPVPSLAGRISAEPKSFTRLGACSAKPPVPHLMEQLIKQLNSG